MKVSLNLKKLLMLLLFPLYLNNINAEELNKNKRITITAVGDVMLDYHLNEILKANGYAYPFENTADYLKEVDITFCNLEAPLTTSKDIIKKEWNFKAEPEAIKSLIYAGIDVVSLANNRILDYGIKGLEETIKQLDAHSIKYVGTWNGKEREPLIVEKNGLRTAFLAYSGVHPESFKAQKNKLGVIPALLEYIKTDVKKAKNLADIVIVSFHFGRELSKEPNYYQIERARLAIDSGADIVIGHHPHVLQPLEYHKDSLIAYSLGNFVFGCYNKVKESAILKINISKDNIEELDIVPVNIYNFEVIFQPRILDGESKKRVLEFMLGDKLN
ncbi:MAG: CapA family protein [Nanoarchaeota archaeon]